jgi:4-diphosphocytidyl-2-C-methyl-D-erythritol kinase
MLTLLSPAKVNLFLRVVRRRPDGYHELASLFQTVSLFDTLSFRQCETGDRLTCSDPDIPIDDRNLVIKALNVFRKHTGRDFFMEVTLDKKIPSEAGLGGGSSNAATTLWAMNILSGFPVSLQKLQEWGAEIGSDVPFFLSTGTAFCQGRGEVMQVLPPLKVSPKLVLAKPSFGMSTVAVYRHVDVNLLEARDPDHDLQQFLEGNVSFYNDLEIPAFSLNPQLIEFKRSLKADHVLMSGSGSSFFCVGENVTIPSGVWHVPVKVVNRIESSWY